MQPLKPQAVLAPASCDTGWPVGRRRGAAPFTAAGATAARAPSKRAATTIVGDLQIEFERACDARDVERRYRAALHELLLRWSWRVREPDAQVRELLDDFEHFRLFVRSRSGDARAAEEFEHHWRTYAQASLGWRLPPDAVDDVLSNFFERVYRLLGEDYPWRSPFIVYLRTTLLNLTRTHAKRQSIRNSREAELDDPVGATDELPDSQPSPEEAVVRLERRQAIERVLGELLPIDRYIVLAHLVEGRSGQEIAAALGMSRDAVYKRLQRGRKKLKSRLEQAGLLPEDGVPPRAATAAREG